VKGGVFGRKKPWLASHNISSRNVLPEPCCVMAGPRQPSGRRDTSCQVTQDQFGHRQSKPTPFPDLTGVNDRGMEESSTSHTNSCWPLCNRSPLVSVTAGGTWHAGDTGYSVWHGACHSPIGLGQALLNTKALGAHGSTCSWMSFWRRTQFSKCF